ncbi:hypothetical protein F1912_13435 [Akkermansia muciniphila]|nr:hypothetical protein F1912_13435 [Akkermansia muciniphila]
MDLGNLGNLGNLSRYDHVVNNMPSPQSNFNPVPPEDFDTEEMRGSMQAILSQNIGQFVVVEFLIGTERLMRKQGILYEVGRSFVTLYDEDNNNYIVCDIFSIKFVYFYYPGDRPRRNYNVLPNTIADSERIDR